MKDKDSKLLEEAYQRSGIFPIRSKEEIMQEVERYKEELRNIPENKRVDKIRYWIKSFGLSTTILKHLIDVRV